MKKVAAAVKGKKKRKKGKANQVEKMMDKPKKDKKKKADKVKCFVVDAKGDTVRTFSRKIKEKGLVKIGWNMRTDGVRMPSRRDRKPDQDQPSGMNALPGKYTIIAQYGEQTAQTEVEVKLDPRVEGITNQDILDLKAADEALEVMVKQSNAAFDKLKKAKKKVELIEKLTETVQDTTKKAMKKLNKSMKEQIEAMIVSFVDKQNLKGIQRNPTTLNRMVGGAGRYMRSSYGKPTPNAQVAIDKAEKAVAEALEKIDAFFSKDWVEYQTKVKAMDFDLFGVE